MKKKIKASFEVIKTLISFNFLISFKAFLHLHFN